MKPAVFISILAITACSNGAAKPIATCAIDQAVYTQESGSGISAGFAKQRVKASYASDLVFFVRQNDKKYWFSFSMPNGYGGPYISPQIDPKLVKEAVDGETPDASLPGMDKESSGDMNFDAFDEEHVNLGAVPQVDDKPPAFLFSAQLGPHFHYGANGGLYAKDPPVAVSRQLWKLTGCDKSPH